MSAWRQDILDVSKCTRIRPRISCRIVNFMMIPPGGSVLFLPRRALRVGCALLLSRTFLLRRFRPLRRRVRLRIPLGLFLCCPLLVDLLGLRQNILRICLHGAHCFHHTVLGTEHRCGAVGVHLLGILAGEQLDPRGSKGHARRKNTGLFPINTLQTFQHLLFL